jgi:hypothetical protein
MAAIQAYALSAIALNAPAGGVVSITKEALVDIIGSHLIATYACTRVWEAWGVGTMTEDDFVPLSECEFTDELADALLSALAPAPQRDAPAGEVINPNESVEYEVVQDGCVQASVLTLEGAKAFAAAEGPWAMSIYRTHRTCVVSNGKPVAPPLSAQPAAEPVANLLRDATSVIRNLVMPDHAVLRRLEAALSQPQPSPEVKS